MTARGMAAPGLDRGPRPADLHYASFEGRVVASILDLLVLFIIASVFVTAGALIVLMSSDFERTDPSTTAINIFWGSVGSILPAVLLYFFIGLAWKGQTVGAAVMQIMVVRSDGRALGIVGSIARVIGLLVYVLFIGTGLVAAYTFKDSNVQAGVAVAGGLVLAALGVLWAAFDPHRRMLHDRIAGTIVVRTG